jgi:hypothetical protein
LRVDKRGSGTPLATPPRQRDHSIVEDPVTIDAYNERSGNGKPFPDDAKMAKTHWNPKKQKTYPG